MADMSKLVKLSRDTKPRSRSAPKKNRVKLKTVKNYKMIEASFSDEIVTEVVDGLTQGGQLEDLSK